MIVDDSPVSEEESLDAEITATTAPAVATVVEDTTAEGMLPVALINVDMISDSDGWDAAEEEVADESDKGK